MQISIATTTIILSSWSCVDEAINIFQRTCIENLIFLDLCNKSFLIIYGIWTIYTDEASMDVWGYLWWCQLFSITITTNEKCNWYIFPTTLRDRSITLNICTTTWSVLDLMDILTDRQLESWITCGKKKKKVFLVINISSIISVFSFFEILTSRWKIIKNNCDSDRSRRSATEKVSVIAKITKHQDWYHVELIHTHCRLTYQRYNVKSFYPWSQYRECASVSSCALMT